MNWNEVEGNWKKFEGKVRTQWGKLTDDDIQVIRGDRKQLEGRLQERYGHTMDVARKEVDKFLKNLS